MIDHAKLILMMMMMAMVMMKHLTVTTIMTMMMVAPRPLASKRVDPSHQALDPLQTFLRHLVEGLFIIPLTRCNNN